MIQDCDCFVTVFDHDSTDFFDGIFESAFKVFTS